MAAHHSKAVEAGTQRHDIAILGMGVQGVGLDHPRFDLHMIHGRSRHMSCLIFHGWPGSGAPSGSCNYERTAHVHQ